MKDFGTQGLKRRHQLAGRSWQACFRVIPVGREACLLELARGVVRTHLGWNRRCAVCRLMVAAAPTPSWATYR